MIKCSARILAHRLNRGNILRVLNHGHWRKYGRAIWTVSKGRVIGGEGGTLLKLDL